MKGNNKSMTEKSNMISPEEIEKQNRDAVVKITNYGHVIPEKEVDKKEE